MKRVLLLLSVLLLMGCSANTTEDNSIYKDGTYTATVNGYGGDFEMTVIIKDDKITDITVGENDETPSIGGVAIEQLITNMKEKQSDDIEIVSGATKTSQGMINAYQDILKQAKNEQR